MLTSKGDEDANVIHLISITSAKEVVKITSVIWQNFQNHEMQNS